MACEKRRFSYWDECLCWGRSPVVQHNQTKTVEGAPSSRTSHLHV